MFEASSAIIRIYLFVKHFFLAFSLLTLLSCSLVPPPELTLYQATYDEAEEATESVLSTYARYEKRAQSVRISTFDPDQAALIAPGAEPPLTDLYRRGFMAISNYNVILARYASGESISVLEDDFEALRISLNRLNTALPGISLPGEEIVTGSQTLVGIALARSDAEEFRRSVKKNGPVIRSFLSIVRSDTTSMYDDAKIAVVKGVTTPQSAQKAASDLSIFREMLAGWVLLIDETTINLQALEGAIENGARRGPSIALLAASTDRLAIYAENVKVAQRQLEAAF